MSETGSSSSHSAKISSVPDAVDAPVVLDSATEAPVAASDADTNTDLPGAAVQAGPDAEMLESGPDTEVPAIAVTRQLRPSWLRRPRSKRRRLVSLILLIVLLAALLPGGMIAAISGWNAYQTYTSLRSAAYGGVQHLLNVKTIFNGVKAHPSGFLDTGKLQKTQKELAAAQQDFQQVQYTLDHTSLIRTVTQYAPQLQTQVRSARAASQIGIDVTKIGQQLVSTAQTLAPALHGSLLGASQTPLVTPATLNLIGQTIDTILPELSDIQAQSRGLSLDSLPVSAKDRGEFAQLLQALPQAEADLTQVHDLLGAAGWLLGVDSPRTFLVQTMDRAELRPTGGFTGQYGQLQISGGRIAPFSLRDISLVEYTDNSPTLGKVPPVPYRSWWPFANWGLRDSNLSADFPTSAQMAINLYKYEVGQQVDGLIVFTPFLLEHILQIIGPIQVPAYHDVITAQNLEQRLHYYQQDNAGIYKQIVTQPGVTSTSDRKRFTALLAQLIITKVRQSPPDELIAIGRELLHDLKTKDLQVYVTNPQVEGLLEKYGDAAQMDRSTTHDGLYVVQANISASKASQYVRTILDDTVTLDAQGGATHVLQLHLDYTQIGPVYGYDTYRDYVRVYVPPQSKFLQGNGFDTGNPLCGGPYPACPQNGVYAGGQLLCPPGLYQAGAAAPSAIDPSGGAWLPLDTIGPPTSMVSDEPGRAMFGGLVVVPKNCSMTVTLSWYVPPLSAAPYSLLVQRQAGTFPELNLTILPTPDDCATLNTSGLHFDNLMSTDMTFTPATFHSAGRSSATCYPLPGV